MRKGLFKFDEESMQAVEGWTDDTTWNGWSCPFFTSNNLKKVFAPYVVTFGWSDDKIPQATIHFDDHNDIIESSPMWNGEEFLIGYAPESYCFIEEF